MWFKLFSMYVFGYTIESCYVIMYSDVTWVVAADVKEVVGSVAKFLEHALEGRQTSRV